MSNTLNDNLNIVGESGLEIELMGDDLVIIQKLDDEPNDVGGMTSTELKATFDKAGLLIQKYINETLIPAILAEDATESARSAAEQTRETNEEQRIENETERQKNYTKVCNLVEKMTVAAQTLAAGSEATATVEIDEATGGYKITVGVPKGHDGKDGEGQGDMAAAVYDTQGKAQDIFKYVDDALNNAGSGVTVYEAVIGTEWEEDGDTGVKTQVVQIAGISAENTAKVDHSAASADGTADGYAAFVEEENQYLTYITNGFAETVAGGIKFTIFGAANTVAIPIVVEVV